MAPSPHTPLARATPTDVMTTAKPAHPLASRVRVLPQAPVAMIL